MPVIEGRIAAPKFSHFLPSLQYSARLATRAVRIVLDRAAGQRTEIRHRHQEAGRVRCWLARAAGLKHTASAWRGDDDGTSANRAG